MRKKIQIEKIDLENHLQLGHLFFEFWPEKTSLSKELEAAKEILSDENQEAFLVKHGSQYVGFIQVSIRHEYVDGMTSPFVGYIEGIYIRKEYQKMGIGGDLIKKGEDWAVEKGCTQMGSDTGIENKNSIGFHNHMGYKDIHRYVSFIKDLRQR